MPETIEYKMMNGKVLTLTISENMEYDVDDLTTIDHSNLLGEYLTAPFIFNQIANIRSKLEKEVRDLKLEKEILHGKIYDATFDSYVLEYKKKPSIPQVESAVNSMPDYSALKRRISKAEYHLSLMENLYWSLKDKSKKLDMLLGSIKPEEFGKSIIEKQVNKVLLKIGN